MWMLYMLSDDDVGEVHLELLGFVRDAFNFSTRIRRLKAEFISCTTILSGME